MAGPDAPIRRFEHCWFPWTGRITGQSKPMGYWILWPKSLYEGGDPTVEYPILIMLQGGSLAGDRAYHDYCTPTTGGATCQVHNHDVVGSPYYTHEAIVILPDTSDCTEWIEYADSSYNKQDFYYFINYDRGHYSGIHPLRALIESLINKTTSFYDTDACSSVHSGLPATPTVDSDRIYMVGYSYGGGATFPLLMCMRDMLAGVVCGAGWPHGAPYSDVYRPNSNDYSLELRAAIREQMKRVLHVPVLFHGGLWDKMFHRSILGWKAAYDEVAALMGVSHSCLFAFYGSANHAGGGVGFSTYDESTSYYKDWFIKLTDGSVYRSLQDNNLNNEPSASPMHWELMAYTWEAGQAATANDIVVYGSVPYKVLNTHVMSEGNEPDESSDFTEYLSGGWVGWTGYLTYTLDVTNQNVQEWDTQTGGNYKSAIDWLFSLTKPIAPIDPHPDDIIESNKRYNKFGLLNVDYAHPVMKDPVTSPIGELQLNGYEYIEVAQDGEDALLGVYNKMTHVEMSIASYHISSDVVANVNSGETLEIENNRRRKEFTVSIVNDVADITLLIPKTYAAPILVS